MVIKMEWNGQTYDVDDFSYDLSFPAGTDVSDAVPGHVSVTIELPPEPNPGKEILDFAKGQHGNFSGGKGEGTITVYSGAKKSKDDSQSLQTIKFKDAYFVDIDGGSSEQDSTFRMRLQIVSTDMTVSTVQFANNKLRTKLGLSAVE